MNLKELTRLIKTAENPGVLKTNVVPSFVTATPEPPKPESVPSAPSKPVDVESLYWSKEQPGFFSRLWNEHVRGKPVDARMQADYDAAITDHNNKVDDWVYRVAKTLPGNSEMMKLKDMAKAVADARIQPPKELTGEKPSVYSF